jgi:cytosine permease
VSANSILKVVAEGDLPPVLWADLTGPSLPRRGWLWTIGPAFASVFIWVPLLDRLGTDPAGPAQTLGIMAAAVLSVLACHLLLYDLLALWGFGAGQRLTVVAASTFGTSGSEWITGLGVAAGALVFWAVSLWTAIRMILLGLLACRLIDASALEPVHLGTVVLENPVVLVTTLFWIFITGMASLLRLTGVIFALLQVYTPVALVLLGLTAWLAHSAAPASDGGALAAATSHVAGAGLGIETGLAHVVQLVFGGFALSGLLSVEWGMTAAHRRDVRIGGWVSILLAGSWCVAMALLTVHGAILHAGSTATETSGLCVPHSFHWAIFEGIGGAIGSAILMLLGLVTLAPACTAAWICSRRLKARWPALRRSAWTWIAGLFVFALVATSWAGRIEPIFSLMGAFFASAAGAMVSDALRQRLAWRGLRPGFHAPGLLAWLAGLAVGLVPLGGSILGWDGANRFQPAALFAFFTAAVVYQALAALGLESAHVAVPEIRAEYENKPVAPASSAVPIEAEATAEAGP